MTTTAERALSIACVAAARPNFMKIKPVVDGLEAVGASTTLVHTGQHYTANMSDVFFTELGLRQPDVDLAVGSGTHAEQTGRTMMAFEQHIADHRPDAVVVVGDVNATLACALVASKAGIPLAHVEAGLRSGDWTMPEEVNRVVVDRLSDLLLAPSPDAVTNLEREATPPERIHLVGNVMIDTLLTNVERARARSTLTDLGVSAGGYAVLTLHRPSNVDDVAILGGLIQAANDLSEQLPIVFPAHPRTRQRLDGVSLAPSVKLIEPLGYLDFLSLQAGAGLMLTDSGGIQEETTVLGVPCLTLRTTTERPITITEGTNRLVGIDPDEILAACEDVFRQGVPKRRPTLWDGRAGERVAGAILGHLQ